jgi:murein DD-endopeptidase MepM/ murein hydrolase activator NlpD
MQIQRPTRNSVSQGKHGDFNAVDYTSWAIRWIKRRPEVYAVEDGIVKTGKEARMGNYIQLTSTNGARRHGFGHLEKFYVKSGQKVYRGQLIGKMGYTGFTIPAGVGGTHLHQVTRDNATGKYIYPINLVNKDFRIFTPSVKTVTTTSVLNVRADATTKSKKVGTLLKGARVKVVGSVNGEKVAGINKWYLTSAGRYIWSGATK